MTSLLKEYDSLAISSSEMESISNEELLERVAKRDQLIKEMSSKDIDELLKRRISWQYKIKIKKIRGE